MKPIISICSLLAAAVLLLARSDGYALAGELERPGIAATAKTTALARKGIHAALNRQNCKFLSGFFLNSSTTLWYDSDARALSLFLDDLANIPELILHVSFVKELSREAAWNVHHQADRNRFHVRVRLGGKIAIEDVYLPF